MNTKPPIVLFVYERIMHTKETVQALLCNFGVEEHDLIIYSDSPRKTENNEGVETVRDYLKTIEGFKSVSIHLRPYNYGLAKSIIEGVSEVLTRYDQIIILEDDMVTSPFFLKYMNDALNLYADDERVISIHGYVYPVQQTLPEAFFLRGADCWGWATWRRGWAHFNPDGRQLLNELKSRKLVNEFDFNGTYLFSKMLSQQVKGKNDSWAIRWHASAFLKGKLTLYPGRSLVNNIGIDGSGTHCSESSSFNAKLSIIPINLDSLEVLPSNDGYRTFEEFFRNLSDSKPKSFHILFHRFFQSLLKFIRGV